MTDTRARHALLSLMCGSAFLVPPSHASEVVGDDLLTASNRSSPWQECDTDSLGIDVSLLGSSQCAYRTTPATVGVNYRMTCGVHVVDYASITLAFLDANADTLATRSTEMVPGHSGASSVTLASPPGTVSAAVGIYGEAGSGFQDCVLIDDAPPPQPTKGSVSGVTWFDENGDSVLDGSEDLINGSVVKLYQDGVEIDQADTDADGGYYFGNLDIDTCYTVGFGASDTTLQGGPTGGDNDAANDGLTPEFCLSEAEPNVIDCDSSFVASPAVEPPADYAVCGVSWKDDNENGVFDASDVVLANVEVKLIDVATGVVDQARTDDNGNYAFGQLPPSDYRVSFVTPDGHEITASAGQPIAQSSYVLDDGRTPVFALPGDGNTAADSACSIRDVNAGYIELPVALAPTVAKNDSISAELGASIDIDALANDLACDGAVVKVDLLGHNVPGNVVFDAMTNRFAVSGTAASGHFTIQYGIRGSCGSYDTATITVEIIEAVPAVAVTAPDAPICRIETGGNAVYGGVDVFHPRADGFAPRYELYDRNRNLVTTQSSDDVSLRYFVQLPTHPANHPWLGNWEIEWYGGPRGFDQVSIHSVAAVENGVRSAPTLCTRTLVSPIALDLPNRGRIERTRGDYSVDMDADGTPEALSEWFAPSAGILISGTELGQIDGDRLFGDVPGVHADGFEELATLDDDRDGKLAGSELIGLALWTDLDGDTIVDAGEVSSLDDHGIVTLGLEHHKFMARAITDDGGSLLMEDVWLALTPTVAASR